MKLENMSFKKINPTSGASRNKFKLILPLLIKIKKKQLTSKFKNNAGRSSYGRITVHSKGSLSKSLVRPVVNFANRDTSISFITSFNVNCFDYSMSSLLYLSSGSVKYVPTTVHHQLFSFTYFLSLNNYTMKSIIFMQNNLLTSKIKATFSILIKLPKNQPISLLELYPSAGIQFTRSAGSKASMVKLDTRTSSALVKLSSGVKKVFSIYSIGSTGSPAIKEKQKLAVHSAGFHTIRGRKPNSRGIAKNPVDHPHGGRTKSIKYPRTPWGKTTKFK